jgi:hypothetical protein
MFHWTTFACFAMLVCCIVMAVRSVIFAGQWDFVAPLRSLCWMFVGVVGTLLLLLVRAWGWV